MCKYINHVHGFIEMLLGICGIAARICYNSNRIFIVMSYLRLIHDTMVSYYSICTSFSPSGADIFTLEHLSCVRKQWRLVNGWYVINFWQKILEMAQNAPKMDQLKIGEFVLAQLLSAHVSWRRQKWTQDW